MTSVISCVYCGFNFPEGTPRSGATILKGHIVVCEAHPMRALEVENASLRALIDVGTKKNPVIQLWRGDGAGLIIPSKSGITYSNQTGGLSCQHPEQEGSYVPLAQLASPPHVGCMDYGGLDDSEADEIDAYFELKTEWKWCVYLKVDRDKLKDSHEAWIWITCLPISNEFHILGSYHGSALYTYPNCD